MAAWKRTQEWDEFLPEKKTFVQGMIGLCGAEYSNIRTAGAQYDIIKRAEAEQDIGREREERKRHKQLAKMAAEAIVQAKALANSNESVKSAGNEATDTSNASRKAPVEMPPPKVAVGVEPTRSAVKVPKNTTNKGKPKSRMAPITNSTQVASVTTASTSGPCTPTAGDVNVKDGAELFMECIYNAMDITIPAKGAVDILGSICSESTDGSFTKRNEGGTMTLPGDYAGAVCKAIGVVSTSPSDAGYPVYDIPNYGHIMKTSAIYNRLTETQNKPRGDVSLQFVSEARSMELKRDYEAKQTEMEKRQLAEMLNNLDDKPKVIPVKRMEILVDKLLPVKELSVEPTTPAHSLTSPAIQQDIFHNWSSEAYLGSSRPASSVAPPSPNTPNYINNDQLGMHIRRLGENTPRILRISPTPQNDDNVMFLKVVTAHVPPRAARFIKEESHEEGEIVFKEAEPAVLLPPLDERDLLLRDEDSEPSQARQQGLDVYHAASNKMVSNSLVWDDWENANNNQLLRMGIVMASKHDAVRPSIWTLAERGVPPYEECEEGFVRVPFLSYAHNVAPALDNSDHLFAHRLWFCHYITPPLVYRIDNQAPDEVIHCKEMIRDFVMSKLYTAPWLKSLNKFLSELRDLERRCKLAMESLFRHRGGCGKEDYLIFVGWMNYTLGQIMEVQMDQCLLPCAEFDPKIAYPTRQDHIAKLALNHIKACVKGNRFTLIEKKKSTREQMNSRVFSVMNPNEREAVETAHTILEDAVMAGSNLPMAGRMVEVVRARRTVMPTLKSFYGKVSVELAVEMSVMLAANPETLNDRMVTERINLPEL